MPTTKHLTARAVIDTTPDFVNEGWAFYNLKGEFVFAYTSQGDNFDVESITITTEKRISTSSYEPKVDDLLADFRDYGFSISGRECAVQAAAEIEHLRKYLEEPKVNKVFDKDCKTEDIIEVFPELRILLSEGVAELKSGVVNK